MRAGGQNATAGRSLDDWETWGSPRFPLKGSFKGDVEQDKDVDILCIYI